MGRFDYSTKIEHVEAFSVPEPDQLDQFEVPGWFVKCLAVRHVYAEKGEDNKYVYTIHPSFVNFGGVAKFSPGDMLVRKNVGGDLYLYESYSKDAFNSKFSKCAEEGRRG